MNSGANALLADALFVQRQEPAAEVVSRGFGLAGVEVAHGRLRYGTLLRDFCLRETGLCQFGDLAFPVHGLSPKHRIADILGNGLPIVNVGRLPPMKTRTEFGQRMFDARTRAKKTQMEVCGKLKISQGTLSELENSANGSSRTVEFAQLYGCSARWLATGDGSPAPTTAQDDGTIEIAETDWAMLQALREMSDEDRQDLLKVAQERAEKFKRLAQEAIRRFTPAATAGPDAFQPKSKPGPLKKPSDWRPVTPPPPPRRAKKKAA
jgi:transcriptional regulator with XRE-family HTH domain